MPAVEIERTTAAGRAAAWAFVSDMDCWAPLLTGYQSHEQIDGKNSRWTVRGELGGLTRLAEFEVSITDWVEPDHIAFTLAGLDEPFAGSGAFHVADVSGAEATGTRPAPRRPPRSSWWHRLRARAARWLLGRVTTLAEEPIARPQGATGSVLRCRLEVNAGGGSGPIMNLLLGPILEAVAADTAARLVGALDAGTSGSEPIGAGSDRA